MILPFPISAGLEAKCSRLAGLLQSHECVAIAFSGGVDSSFLTWFAIQVLKDRVFAILLVTPFLSSRELKNALKVAEAIGARLTKVELDPTRIPAISANSMNRCYFCKMEMMGRVKERASELGCSAVLDGTHVGDSTGHRPGREALRQLGIISPLALSGFKKSEIRELSRLAGLSTWNKTSQSCLATRIPYETELNKELLSRVEKCEALLLDLGCSQVRVRAHGDLARIEVDPEDFSRLLEPENRAHFLHHFRQLGFRHICLDLEGYRSGSFDTNPHPSSPQESREVV